MRVLVVPRSGCAPVVALEGLLGLSPVDILEEDEGLRLLFADDPALDATTSAALPGVPVRWEAPHRRDGGATTVLALGPRRIGGLWIGAAEPAVDAVVLVDGLAFGTGLHPTTALCLEALAEMPPPARVVDVGTGNGVLALAALRLGAGHALGVDLDPVAVEEASENAARNELSRRFQARVGGPEVVTGRAAVVMANILAGPLQTMAHALSGLVASGGELVLSGIPASVEAEVIGRYMARGMHRGPVTRRGGWSCVRMLASW